MSGLYCKHLNKDYSDKMVVKGSKIAELSYMYNILASDNRKSNKNVLVVGEREGREGVTLYTSETLDLNVDNLDCIDISDLEPNSYLSDLVDSKLNVNFINGDLVAYEPDNNYDYVICISVLEHFGMKYGNHNMFGADDTFEIMNDDFIRWNHDLRGILKMSSLLNDDASRVIITIPTGGYMNYDENGFPFLRYYNRQRRDIIQTLLQENEYNIYDEKFYISNDFVNWDETNVGSMSEQNYRHMNPYSPNGLWCFCVGK